MAFFRTANSSDKLGPVEDLTALCGIVDDTLRPGNFFVRPDLQLVWTPRSAEETRWEIFRGRLLEDKFTRNTERFLAWNIYQQTGAGLSAQPVLAVKWSPENGKIHVVRGLLCHVWETFESVPNVLQSRETTGWQCELVGTIALAEMTDLAEVRDELICLLWQAVVGTSRLPLNSVETPLPAFSLGQLAYVYTPDAAQSPMNGPAELLRRGLVPGLNPGEEPKVLESFLRSCRANELSRLAELFRGHWRRLGRTAADLTRLMRAMFNEVSLSPYTGFVDNALLFVGCLVDQSCLDVVDEIDFLAHLLGQTGRHLTAYDLVRFHHRGANYPDALMLEAVLGRFLDLVKRHADLFEEDSVKGRRRRRALRQGCLLRKIYEGHAVPDAPTSPGENMRVLPAPFVRVPEEQIQQPAQRYKQLFRDTSWSELLAGTVRSVFQRSLADLNDADELRELGLALFIDRPLGKGKAVGEPDHTPLLAHLAYSATLARARLHDLDRLARELGLGFAVAELAPRLAETTGLSLNRVAAPDRPTPALADAHKVADDFVVLRTVGPGLRTLLSRIDIGPLGDKTVRIVARLRNPAGGDGLVFFDESLEPIFEVESAGPGFVTRAGVEMPRGGLRVCSGKDDGLVLPLR